MVDWKVFTFQSFDGKMEIENISLNKWRNKWAFISHKSYICW